MNRNPHIAAVVWAPEQDRTEQFAARLNAHLYCIHYLQFQRPWLAPIKYVPQFFKTLIVLLQQRPKVVYVTNPPVFAPLSVWLYCIMSGARFVMDTHSPALYSRRWGWTRPLQRAAARRALMNITDQERFRRMFDEWGAEAMILEKPLKPVELTEPPPLGEAFKIAVVNIFAVDEPLMPILDAARLLPDVCFYVMGDTDLADPAVLQAAPPNVVFTGWLHSTEYWRRLQDSHAVMALTTYPHSLLAGATDSVAVGRPMILSEQPSLTAYFTGGVAFVDNTAESITAGIRHLRDHYSHYVAEVTALRKDKQVYWENNFRQLDRLIQSVIGNAV